MVGNLPANVGHMGSIPGWGRSPGEGKGTQLQCPCLHNSVDSRASWVAVHGITESDTAEHTGMHCSVLFMHYSCGCRGFSIRVSAITFLKYKIFIFK